MSNFIPWVSTTIEFIKDNTQVYNAPIEYINPLTIKLGMAFDF